VHGTIIGTVNMKFNSFFLRFNLSTFYTS